MVVIRRSPMMLFNENATVSLVDHSLTRLPIPLSSTGCQDTFLARSAAWCGCPQSQVECHLCPGGVAPPSCGDIQESLRHIPTTEACEFTRQKFDIEACCSFEGSNNNGQGTSTITSGLDNSNRNRQVGWRTFLAFALVSIIGTIIFQRRRRRNGHDFRNHYFQERPRGMYGFRDRETM